MSDNQKLRMTVGPHTFEAEGPAEAVQAQFEAWRELIGSLGDEVPNPSASSEGVERPLHDAGSENLGSVIVANDEATSVTLQVLPQGEHRDADAALLVLYGFHVILLEEHVIVGRIKEALIQSGLQIGRIDRILGPYTNSGLVRKGGRGPGGRYRLSNTGLQRARDLVETLA